MTWSRDRVMKDEEQAGWPLPTQETSMKDPTYVREEIRADPRWELAYILSEILNDDSPIGWSKYVGPAECLLAEYKMEKKK